LRLRSDEPLIARTAFDEKATDRHENLVEQKGPYFTISSSLPIHPRCRYFWCGGREARPFLSENPF